MWRTTIADFNPQFLPASAPHPGEVLREELDARNMTQAELATRMSRPPKVVNEIIKGKKTITAETALELERALGITASFWTNLGTIYRLVQARDAKRATLEREGAWLRQFPVAEMAKRGWIPSRRAPAERVDALLQFFGIQSFTALDELAPAAAFRKTPAAKVDRWPLEAWLRRGEQLGAEIQAEPFSADQFRDALANIRELAAADMPNLPRLREICAEAGVAVVVVPQLPKAGVNGATRWIRRDRALIQLSLRYKWLDVFWFTFFHEAAHVLDGYTRDVVIDANGDGEASGAERRADRFAADMLIRREDWTEFIDSSEISWAAIRRFAARIGTHPAVVVGRLQHERRVPRNRFNDLRPRFDGTALAGVDQ